jgi:hypothetical protein
MMGVCVAVAVPVVMDGIRMGIRNQESKLINPLVSMQTTTPRRQVAELQYTTTSHASEAAGLPAL